MADLFPRAPLASDDAEGDDGTHGNRSVPAMLRSIRELLSSHERAVTESHTPSVEEALSTVMGSLKPGKLTKSNRSNLIAGFPRIIEFLSDLADENDEGADAAEAIRNDLHSLIKQAAEAQNEKWTDLSVPPSFPDDLASEVFATTNESLRNHIQKAKSFAVQCLTLVTGTKAGQPWKREQAVTQFDEHLKFLTEKLTCIQMNKKQLNEARNLGTSLRNGVSLADQIQNSELAEQLRRCDSTLSTFTQNINSLTKEVLAEFNDGVYDNKHTGKGIELSIPNDVVEKSRGAWVRQELPSWYKYHAQELYPVIPYINRIIGDYDALKGEYWKPPTNAEADILVPEAFRDEWKHANKALARMLVKSMSSQMLTKFTFTYSYGSQQDKQTRAEDDDGLSLAFALVTLSSPNSSEYRDSIDRQIHNCAEMVASGNPTDFVKSARITLQEAIRLNLPVRWHVAKQIINHLSSRHHLFTRDIGMLSNACPDPEDAASHFDALLTKIEDVNSRIKEVNGDSWWVTNSRAHTAFTGNPNQDCKFGMNCNKRQSGECKRRHLTSNKGKGGGKGGNTSANPGRCAKQGCKEQKSPSGELCKSCFESAKADGGSYQNAHGKRIQIKSVKNANRQKVRKQTANMAKKIETAAVKKALEMTATNPTQLALTAPPESAGQQRIYMTVAEYTALTQNNVVSSDAYANHTDALTVIGGELEKHICGPASYKRHRLTEFLRDESVLNIPLTEAIDKFKRSINDQ
jgi:hypothetical protein